MKAFLLAAGKGTRLSPYTDETPKCLIPVQGQPLLKIWLDHLLRFGIQEVLINTHHHAQQVMTFVDHYPCRKDMHIVISYEPELLGSAGTLWHNRGFVDGEDDFLIFYADNLTDLNLQLFMDFHYLCRKKENLLTMALFHAPNPEACGIAELDSDQKILSFVEKPKAPQSSLANAGIYMASQEIFHYFPEKSLKTPGSNSVLDLGHHVLPLLTGKMFGYIIHEYLRDIGTIESSHLALEEWPQRD